METVNNDTCWWWAGPSYGDGHARIYLGWVNGKTKFTPAYRAVYEALVGPIPPKLELDHLCENPACINPEHLEPVTHQENIRRHFLRRTHCKHGHKFTPENIIWANKKGNASMVNPTGRTRYCKSCKASGSQETDNSGKESR